MSAYQLEIREVVVMLRDSTDLVLIRTTLPPAFPPAITKQSPDLQFECTKGAGKAYVKKHFGVEPRIVDSRVTKDRS